MSIRTRPMPVVALAMRCQIRRTGIHRVGLCLLTYVHLEVSAGSVLAQREHWKLAASSVVATAVRAKSSCRGLSLRLSKRRHSSSCSHVARLTSNTFRNNIRLTRLSSNVFAVENSVRVVIKFYYGWVKNPFFLKDNLLVAEDQPIV